MKHLQTSDEFYRLIVETSQEGIWLLDSQGNTSFVNEKMAQMLGYTPQEMLGKHLFDFMDDPGRQEAGIKLERRKHGISEHHDFRFCRKDGSDFWGIISTNPFFNEGNEYQGTLGMVTDITKRKKAEQQLISLRDSLQAQVDLRTSALSETNDRLLQEIEERTRVEASLQQSHTLLSALSKQVPGALFKSIIAPDGHASTPYSSEKLLDIYEVAPEEIQENIDAIAERFHPEDRQRIFDSISEAARELKQWECEYRVILPRQGLKWLYGAALPQRLEDGAVVFYGIIMEITERKLMEESLKNSEEQFIEAFNKCPLLMAISTVEEGRYIEVNSLFLETLGLRREQVIGVTSRELKLFADPDQRAEILKLVEKQGYATNCDARVRKPDGTIMHGLFSAQIITLQQQQCLLTTFIDFTDRHESEKALKDSEERYRRLFEVESDSVVLLDKESGLFLDVNSAAVCMYGYTKEEFMGLHHTAISADPEASRQALVGYQTSIPLRWHKKKDGTTFPVEISGSYFWYKGREVSVAAIRDITTHVQGEERLVELNRKLQALNEHAQKVQEQERFAIARDIHDEIGQNLTVLKLDLEWIASKLPGNSPDIVDRITEMGVSIEQLTSKVQQIAANLRPPLLDQVGLVAAIECHVQEIKKRSNLEFFLMLNEDVDPIDKDIATTVMRIVQEGLTNIIRHARADEVSISLCKSGRNLILEISDNGCGITPEQMASQGSYGLMGMRERARICHGELMITSSPGNGATLYITIPLENGGCTP